MKISYNWLKDFIDLADYSAEDISQILTKIGLEVESLDKVESIPGGLQGLVVGEVKSCERHPNADKLQVTTVDVGGENLLNIVCGAPNCRTGLKVIVASVGTVCHPTSGEPFKITKSKIRGEVSEGMLCGEDEIGLGASHAGIVELDADARIGSSVKDYYQITDDYCFEIGLTPNRADAASHLGVARDLAAYFRTKLIDVDTYAFSDAQGLDTIVEVRDSEAAPRYAGVNIKNLTVKESPSWLKDKLNTIGIRSINNVVDATNYILHDLGQPLHAFDQDKISGNKVVVRKAKENETFVTLDGVERKLSSEDLVIADDEKPMCIAGVFGGSDSGVTDNTKNIFLESAYFNAVSVRKTAKRHGLKTDSSFRFERGTDPDMPLVALRKAVLLILEIAGGEVSSVVSDVYPAPIAPFNFDVSYDRVRKLIGKDIADAEIKEIMEALAIEIKNERDGVLKVSVPPYRVDVTREVDVIEEVLRIYGYDNIEIGTQIKASLNTSDNPDKEVVINQICDILIGNGYREILSNSLTKESFVENQVTAVKLLNPLSSDLDTMRQNLLYSMLTALSYNQRRKSTDLKFFEFGKGYFISEKGYDEQQLLGIGLSGRIGGESWLGNDPSVSYYHLKSMVDALIKRFNIDSIRVEETESSFFSYGLDYKKGEKVLVRFGAVKGADLKNAEVSGEVFFAQFDMGLLLKVIRKNRITYQDVPKFPAVRRDLALLIDDSVTFEKLRHVAQRTEKKLLKDIQIFDVYKGDKLPSGKKSYALSFTIQDEEKTLTDKQIDNIIQKLILNFEKEVGASVR